jgi:hypothetical protein
MKRRQFSALILASPLLGLAPAISLASGPEPSPPIDCGWTSVDRCQGLLGQHFEAIGPAQGHLALTEVIPYSHRRGAQFFVRFQADRELPEGLYQLENARHSKALFLQPVHGQDRLMEAAFSLT